MTRKNLLVELLVEELPPKSLKLLGTQFAELLFAALKQQDLVTDQSTATPYASPRRLAVHISDVAVQGEDKSIAKKLMPVKVGLDSNGEATPPLLKKLASLGADASAVPSLKRELDGKNEVLILDSLVKGTMLAEGLQKALDETLSQLPIPKVMTYQLDDGWESVNFVRPAHGLVALHGVDIVPVSTLGLTSGRETQGHRFEAKVDPVVVNDADSYAQQLADDGAVIASFTERREKIAKQLQVAAEKEHLKPIDDDALLDEVAALVEHPNVLVGTFEPAYLDVPHECLILTMKANQKYFPMLDAQGKLANKFLLVSNICPSDSHHVVDGNERVVRSRLADAQFFFEQDRKKTLESRISGLDKVIYHNKLGMQGERINRVSSLAYDIGLQLGDETLAQQAKQAAKLCKADLLTEMVGEFPELQGIMGNYYAKNDGLSDEIADAIADHYKPRFAGDELPRNPVGICVALADKLETLVGLFGIKQIPTGDKDPFALRRHALGVVRMLIEKALPLSLNTLLDHAKASFADKLTHPEESPQLFIYDRLAGSLKEQGYQAQEIDAVLSLMPDQLAEIPKRLDAVRAFSTLPEAESLAAANKRVHNILQKGMKGVSNAEATAEGVAKADASIDPALLQESAEKTLYDTLNDIKATADKAFEAGYYTESLQSLAALKAPVDQFFDDVMVFTDDLPLRENRLCLLRLLRQAMNRVADLSKLAS